MNSSICFSLFILICFFSSGLAQTIPPGKSALKILVVPQDAVIYIDSVKIKKSDTTLFLQPGSYQIKVWAPYRELSDSTVNLIMDSMVVFTKLLNLHPEYISFRKELTEYKHKRSQRIGLVFTGSVILGANYFVASSLAKKKFDMALDDKLNYELSYNQPDLDYFKQQYAQHRKQYHIMKGVQYGLGLCSAAVLSVCIRNIVRYYYKNKYPKPRYYPDTLLTGIDIGTTPVLNNSFGGHIAIKF